MRRILLWLLAAFHAASGLTMLLAGSFWWAHVPGVTETGHYNPHFVADVGLAFIASGAGLALGAVRRDWRTAAWAGALFPILHAGLHLGEMFQSGVQASWISDAVAIHLPAALGAWAALSQPKE